jgi:hypothetical protein
MSDFVLGPNRHGKGRVRVLKVRGPSRQGYG